MYKNQTISIILPAYNEERTISNVIIDLKKLNIFDEIIAVDNNSTDNTKTEILKHNVTYVSITDRQGSGAAVVGGLNVAKTNLIMIFEPEGSFNAIDCLKLLKIMDEEKLDAVFTSRTSGKMIFYLKYGNWLYAKFLRLLFGGSNITDVGSSFRLIKKENYDKFKENMKYPGPEFQVELSINLMRQKIKIKQIPIEYKHRIGPSKYTGNFSDSFMVALRFTKVVFLKFFKIE